MDQFAAVIEERQINSLWVVGSNDETAEVIDKSYKKYLQLMENHLKIAHLCLVKDHHHQTLLYMDSLLN